MERTLGRAPRGVEPPPGLLGPAEAARMVAAALRRGGEDADVRAQGIALYEAVAGRPPPTRPGYGPPAVPAALDLVVRRAIAADPAFGFRSAEEFAMALDTLAADLGDSPAGAGPAPPAVSAIAGAGSSQRRHRAGVLGVALAVLAVAGVATGWPTAVFGGGPPAVSSTGRSTSSPITTRGWAAATAPGPVVLAPAGAASQPSAPTGPTDGLLSCPTEAFCAALVPAVGTAPGSSVIETYSAGTWTATTAPGSGLPVELDAVSCPVAGWCMAVGRDGNGEGGDDGLVLTLSEGTWKPTPVPGAAGLDHVACTGIDTCMATGETATTAALWTLASGAWTVSPPDAALAASGSDVPRLTDIACGEPGACVAVGHTYTAGGVEEGVIETGWAGVWRGTVVPGSTPGSTASLDDVSCVVAFCTAVGGTQAADGSLRPLVEVLDAGRWRTTDLATVLGHGDGAQWTYLTSVSCASARLCAVTAWYYGGADGGRVHSVLLTEVAGHWHAAVLAVAGLGPPAAGGPDVVPWSVSCMAAGSCVAVGGYQDTGGRRFGIIERFAHGAWRAHTAPTAGLAPAAGPDPHLELESLSCPGAACTVLGVYADGSGAVHGLFARATSRP